MKILTKIPYDKKLHFCAGACISILLSIVLNSIILGILIGLLAGVLKEVYDYYDYGGFDVVDMLATWIGSISGGLLVKLLSIYL